MKRLTSSSVSSMLRFCSVGLDRLHLIATSESATPTLVFLLKRTAERPRTMNLSAKIFRTSSWLSCPARFAECVGLLYLTLNLLSSMPGQIGQPLKN